MRYTNNQTTDMFKEHVMSVVQLFANWSDCQRTVAICLLLKTLPYNCLKIIQSAIDVTYAHCNCPEKLALWEKQSNNTSFLTELCDIYKHLTTCNAPNDVQLNNKDTIFYHDYERNLTTENANNNNNFTSHNNNLNNFEKCDKKEDILNEILNFMPMLKIGNDDAKKAYLSFIPFMVEDARRGVISTPIAQQILSFLLMHPALTAEDKR